MQVQEYLRVLLRRGWIILLIAAVGALGALGFSRLQTPIYRTTITLSALPSRPDYGQGLASKDLLRNYSQQLLSTKILQQVIDQLQLDIPAQTLRSRVSTSADEANLTITLEVKDPLEANAPKVAQALADTFMVKHSTDNLQIDQRDRILVDVLDGPTPVEKFSPKTTINTLAGGILGAIVGLFAIFILEYIESANLRSAEDVEKILGVTVLGAIPPFSGGRKQSLVSGRPRLALGEGRRQ